MSLKEKLKVFREKRETRRDIKRQRTLQKLDKKIQYAQKEQKLATQYGELARIKAQTREARYGGTLKKIKTGVSDLADIFAMPEDTQKRTSRKKKRRDFNPFG